MNELTNSLTNWLINFWTYYPCVWLQKRGWHFVASATIMCMSFLTAQFAITIISFLVCLFWRQKRGWHFVASATIRCISFLTAQFAITIISFLVCLFWRQKRGWHFVASATTWSPWSNNSGQQLFCEFPGKLAMPGAGATTLVLRTLMLSLHATCFQSQLVHLSNVLFCDFETECRSHLRKIEAAWQPSASSYESSTLSRTTAYRVS